MYTNQRDFKVFRISVKAQYKSDFFFIKLENQKRDEIVKLIWSKTICTHNSFRIEYTSCLKLQYFRK